MGEMFSSDKPFPGVSNRICDVLQISMSIDKCKNPARVMAAARTLSEVENLTANAVACWNWQVNPKIDRKEFLRWKSKAKEFELKRRKAVSRYITQMNSAGLRRDLDYLASSFQANKIPAFLV
jgi:hypothetical protein